MNGVITFRLSPFSVMVVMSEAFEVLSSNPAVAWRFVDFKGHNRALLIGQTEVSKINGPPTV